MTSNAIETAIQDFLPAAQRGDAVAFGRIVALCQNTVTSIALSMTRNVSVSEDIAQSALLNAWTRLPSRQNPASFLPWLRQITRNLARDQLRLQASRTVTAMEFEAGEIVDYLVDQAPDPEQALADSERQQLLSEVLDELPDDSRELLLLYYREDQSSQQVAQLLGISDASVRKRLSRVRQSLKSTLLLRFGECARSTMPGASFGVGVLALVQAAKPGVAAAAVSSTAMATSKSGLPFLLAPIAGPVIGLLGGVFGFWAGIREYLANPLDRAERRALYGWLATNIFALSALTIAVVSARSTALIVASCLIYGLIWIPSQVFWLSRILSRRDLQPTSASTAVLAFQRHLRNQQSRQAISLPRAWMLAMAFALLVMLATWALVFLLNSRV